MPMMYPDLNLTEQLLDREEATLSKWGYRSRDSKGRKYPELPCPVRTPFQRDRDRIIHSKSFRRLKHKTQVFLAPTGDHFRTRLTHTLEVTQIARGIGRALGLNEDLVEAIALGHDLGHTPFGHAGEKVLDIWCKKNGLGSGFQHHIQSVRVVEKLENDGKGLNLTFEVIEGIRKHTKGPGDYNLSLDTDDSLHMEGRIVKIADRMAYVNHDLQDAIMVGLITADDIPVEFIKIVGTESRERINAMVMDTIHTTLDKGRLALSPVMENTINGLKDFLFENVYNRTEVRSHDDSIFRCLTGLLDIFYSDRKVNEKYMVKWVEDDGERKRHIVDYIAGMTDLYAIDVAQELMLPTRWPIRM
jgi:dGTPase